MDTIKYRMTRPRQIILEELCRFPCHPTADELHRRVRQVLPRVSLGTVYRNLEHLCATGQARRLDVPGAARRYDGDMAPHQHVRCTRCGRVEDLSQPLRLTQLPAPDAAGGFEITGYRLEMQGICPACRRTSG